MPVLCGWGWLERSETAPATQISHRILSFNLSMDQFDSNKEMGQTPEAITATFQLLDFPIDSF